MSEPVDDAQDWSFLDALGPGQAERLDRLLETILWMAWPRRPGFLGVPIEMKGMDAARVRTSLVRQGDDWVLTRGGQGLLTSSEPHAIFKKMAEIGFLPESVVLVPEIAPHVFLAAVIETEAAENRRQDALTAMLRQSPEAREFFKDKDVFAALMMRPVLPDFMDATDAMDTCIRHAIAGVALAISAADAQVNTWANRHGGWDSDGQATAGLTVRFRALCSRAGWEMDVSEEPLASLRVQIQLRNDLLHGNAIAQEQPLEQQAPGRALVLDARRSCLAVRQSLVVLASALREKAPSYLAFCPETVITDDGAWGTARVMTGMRQDSIFPAVAEKYGFDDPNKPESK